MKINKKIIQIMLIPLLWSAGSCDDPLKEEVFSELDPSAYLRTENGVRAALNGTYEQFLHRRNHTYRMLMDVFEAGYGYNESGSFEALYAEIHEQFLWTETDNMASDNWNEFYNIIREANIVLDNLEEGEFDEGFKTEIRPQALALRGYAYSQLLSFFGPSPIFVSSTPDEIEKARPSMEEMLERIESDLANGAEELPVQQNDFGRITKGGALAMLTKHYLNTRQWQKTVNTADQIIELGEYTLLDDYATIFDYDNEQNSELIVTMQSDVANASHWPLMCITIPTDYPLLPNQSTCAARLYAFDSFMDSFGENDERDDPIIRQYENNTGELVQGYGNDKSLMMFKYGPDPNANGNNSGLDLVVIRYADILMAKAEALNEINGPNTESIALLNQIRNRAGAELISMEGYSSKEALRDFILEERVREFYFEGKSREDLVRQGKFISRAQERGLNAKERHNLYPIPQAEVQSNSEIEQNPGY